MKALRSTLRRAAIPTLSVITALIVGAIVIILTDFDALSKLGSDPVRAILSIDTVDGLIAVLALGARGRRAART